VRPVLFFAGLCLSSFVVGLLIVEALLDLIEYGLG